MSCKKIMCYEIYLIIYVAISFYYARNIYLNYSVMNEMCFNYKKI